MTDPLAILIIVCIAALMLDLVFLASGAVFYPGEGPKER
jgi:hypothetical protein